MKQVLLIVTSILFSVLAQIVIKFAGRSGVGAGGLASWLSPWLLLAVFSYGLSFLLTVRIFAENKLSSVVPLMAGATFMLVSLAGVMLFGESLSARKIAGTAAVLVGIFLLAG
jgi:multidrug transporter EmrE-like cation transporter